MPAYELCYTQDRNPLVDYSIKTMWGNPELDSQHQIKLARISSNQGLINDFSFMGKTRFLPKEKIFYHVFTLGGLDKGFWNLGSRGNSWYPHDTWIKASQFSHDRGVALNIYRGDGSLFPCNETYIMDCFEGPTLLIVPVNINYPLRTDKNLYLRCYSTDINVNTIKEEDREKFRFGYSSAIIKKPKDFDPVKLAYDTWVGYKMGMVSFFLNGTMRPIAGYVPELGDLVEVVYDPSVEMILKYAYKKMPDYLSEIDKKRKVILFPNFRNKPHKYRYYDDCDFYVHNKRNGNAYYYHRNSEDAVRQLTHQDYGMAVPYVELLMNRLITEDPTKKTTPADIEIMVVYRKTRWQFDLGPTSSRINDLYLLEDPNKIIQAMTGSTSNIPEWTAAKLEYSATNKVLNGIITSLTSNTVREALGYNGCSVAMSNSPLYMPFVTPGDPNFNPIYTTPPYTSGLGYEVPPTFVERSTAYEYDVDGLLIRKVDVRNQEWYAPKKDAFYVEWSLGEATTWLDYTVSHKDVKIRCGYGFRVYKAAWAIDPNWEPPVDIVKNEIRVTQDGNDIYPVGRAEIKALRWNESPGDGEGEGIPEGGKVVGDWIDITDTDEYRIENGFIIWNFDTVNNVGMVVTDYRHLYNEFEQSHIDNSLSFAITHKWSIGGSLLPLEPGQIDIWMNRHPLIENVDYILDFPNVYIINKMWLKEGKQFFQYRGTGLSKNGLVNTSELGFIADGVLGYNGRYNLRIDRPTKTITGGRLYLTPTVDWAEDINHGNNMKHLNGFPYEVKHIYSANKYVDWYDTYWGYDKSRELDVRVSNYLTEYATYKSNEPKNVVYLEKDKYRLYSPFLSQIVNELMLGFMTAPTPSGDAKPYPDQVVYDLVKQHEWMLKYDPIIRKLDLDFFTVHPYNNWTTAKLTADQLTFVNVVNDLFLEGKVKIEGHFEVKHV